MTSGSLFATFETDCWTFRFPLGLNAQAAIRSGDYKLVKFYEKADVHLYDLSKDLGEENDLAGSMPESAGTPREAERLPVVGRCQDTNTKCRL